MQISGDIDCSLMKDHRTLECRSHPLGDHLIHLYNFVMAPTLVSKSGQRRVIGIALFIATIEAVLVRCVQFSVRLEALHQVRVGDEQLAK